MIYISTTADTVDSLVKRHCAPLFATDMFLHGGHDSSATNATVTFVKFNGCFYAVTCHHVLAAIHVQANSSGHKLMPSVHSGSSITQFKSMHQDGKLRWSFRSCRDFLDQASLGDAYASDDLDRQNRERPDIAIAEITECWPLFVQSRQAMAIDLDSWAEPDWTSVEPIWMAYGFPNSHKSSQSGQVAAPMPRVCVRLESLPKPEKPVFVLCSTLESEHLWGFSGISGGPVLVADKHKDRCAFVGLVFEGFPSDRDIASNPEAIFTGKDIILRGYHLNPEEFQRWLDSGAEGLEISMISSAEPAP